MASNDSLDSDFCNCSICLEIFKEPKILPCLHTFCQNCLNTYILSIKKETNETGYFKCPVCRAVVPPSDPETPVEGWAKLMPTNHMIAALIECSSTDKMANEKICDPCGRDGKSTRGQFWCFECQESLCEVCQKYHKLLKAASGHTVVPVHELNKGDLEMKMCDVDEPCFDHKGESLKVYCVDHQKMCCVICLSIGHRKCENIQTFDQMAESMKDSDETQNLDKAIKMYSQKMEELIVKKNENIECAEKQKQDILEDVARMIEQAKEKLEKCHEEFKTNMCQTHKEQTTKLVDMRERFEIFQKSFENCEKMLQVALKHGSPKQIFITSEKIKTRLEIQLKELQDLISRDKGVSYDLMLDKHLMEMNKSMMLVGNVQVKNTTDNELALSISTLGLGMNTSIFQHQLVSANIEDLEAVKIWDVKGGHWITDAVFLHDGSLLFADYWGKLLSVYDDQGKLLFSHPVKYDPRGVIQSSDHKIFVSDSSTPGIRIYTLEHQNLQQITFIATKEVPYGVDILQGELAVVQSNSIRLFTQDGAQKVIGKCPGNKNFAVSKTDKGSFYCCDEDSVVKYTVDGRTERKQKLQNIKSAQGIANDIGGNIYVCGMDSNNVIILSKDGRSSRIFLSKQDGINKPYSIGFDHTCTRLFITGFADGTTSVFKLGMKTKH